MRCGGRPPEYKCPEERNDYTVRGCQADLLVCPECEENRFPYVKGIVEIRRRSARPGMGENGEKETLEKQREREKKET